MNQAKVLPRGLLFDYELFETQIYYLLIFDQYLFIFETGNSNYYLLIFASEKLIINSHLSIIFDSYEINYLMPNSPTLFQFSEAPIFEAPLFDNVFLSLYFTFKSII